MLLLPLVPLLLLLLLLLLMIPTTSTTDMCTAPNTVCFYHCLHVNTTTATLYQ